MNALKWISFVALGAAVSACSTAPALDGPERVTAKQAPAAAVAVAEEAPDYRINGFSVSVPDTLVVSERNGYYPGADIVWREDPIGDRHAQVKAIFDTAFARGAKEISGSKPVNVEVLVERFHALTEKARYTIGGVHAITFKMQLRDPKTGALLTEPKRIKADLDALGGLAAIRAENQGITQKVRITQHLANVLKTELETVEGHSNVQLGLVQAINQI